MSRCRPARARAGDTSATPGRDARVRGVVGSVPGARVRRGPPRVRPPSARASSSSSSSSSRRSSRPSKRLYLIRHGRTEMNEYLASNRWDATRFRGPRAGGHAPDAPRRGAGERAAPDRPRPGPAPEVLVASPLTRALRTAELAFEGSDFRCPEDDRAPIRRVTCALARERVFHASDVGRRASAIEKDFPGWCLREIREPTRGRPVVARGGRGGGRGKRPGGRKRNRRHRGWVPPGGASRGRWGRRRGRRGRLGTRARSSSPGYPRGRGDAGTRARVRGEDGAARGVDRREGGSVLALVAHWGGWYSLTGREFENCELVGSTSRTWSRGRERCPCDDDDAPRGWGEKSRLVYAREDDGRTSRRTFGLFYATRWVRIRGDRGAW